MITSSSEPKISMPSVASAGQRWSILSKLGLTAVGSMLLTSSVVLAEETSLIEKEIQKRHEGVILAQELLLQGDESYKKAKYAAAVESYSKAFQLIPKAAITSEIRQAAAERYAQAVVENAKALTRVGKTDVAREQLNAVLSPGVAPGNVAAKKALEKLDDPIRTSPTLTPEHVNDVVQVGQWLRKAESYYLQGQYDAALVAYEEVIKLDPFNKAARRGMEKVTARISDYTGAAKDQLRAQALQDVDAQWEMPVTPKESIPVVEGQVVDDDQLVQDQIAKNNKVRRMLVPEVNFQDASFEQALRTIRALTRELDTEELDPSLKGVNFVTRFGDEESGFLPKIKAAKFSLQLRNVPMSEVLDRVTQATGTYWRAERHAIVIRPQGSESYDLEVRTFRVPMGFMDNAGENTEEDVFDNSQGGVKARLTAIDYFKKLGIDFPEGSYAIYARASNTLRVKNTLGNLESIEAFIRAQSMNEKVMVVIKMTLMEIKETDLKELGYDWLLEPKAGNTIALGGGTQGNQASPINAIPNTVPGVTFQGQGITAGNRSGRTAFALDSIDGELARAQGDSGIASITPPRAASPLQFTGTISDARYQTILRALKQKDDKSQIWVPSVVTAPGQKATLYSGREFFYFEDYEPGEVPNGGGGIATPVTPTGLTSRELGMLVELEPTVSDDKQYIDLNVNPTLSTFQGFVNYGSPLQTPVLDPITGLIVPFINSRNEILQPVFRTIRANTNVTIQDGHTLVIGGLLQERVEKVDDKTPVLGSLPMVGRFFKNEGIRSTKTAVIIFVKAELVDPTGRPWRER